MTIVEFMVTYAVCWWLVLLMVLPHQAEAPETPGAGHVPSAPANPQIRRKMRWATGWALIPAIVMYFVVDAAHGAEIYHVGGAGKCASLAVHTPRADVAAVDGYATGGKQVAPATMGGNSTIGNRDHYDMPLQIPASGRLAGGRNADLSQSWVKAGDVSVGRDGSVSLDGQVIAPQDVLPPECAEGK